MNLLYRYITQGRVEGDRPPISPRSFARLLLTHPDKLTDKQIRLRDELTTGCPEMIDLADLITGFAGLLKHRRRRLLFAKLLLARGYPLMSVPVEASVW